MIATAHKVLFHRHLEFASYRIFLIELLQDSRKNLQDSHHQKT